MSVFTLFPQATSSKFRNYDPTSIKPAKSRTKGKKRLQESKSNLSAVPQQTLQIQTTGQVENVEGIDLENCDPFRVDYRIGTHEFVIGDSSYQLRPELYDEGFADDAALSSALNEPFRRGGRNLNSITENDTTENHLNTASSQLDNSIPNFQDINEYLNTASGSDHTKQRGDLDTAVEHAFSIENPQNTCHDGPLTEDKTSFSIANWVNKPSKTQKRPYQSSIVDETIIIQAPVPGVISNLEPENTHPEKRRRMVVRQSLSPTNQPTCTPESTPLPHPGDQRLRSIHSGSFVPSSLGGSRKEDGTISLSLPPTDLCDIEYGHSTHVQGVFEELLQARRSISTSKRLGLEQDINQESGRDLTNRLGSGKKTKDIFEEELSHSEACAIPPARSQQPTSSASKPQMGRRLLNAALRTLDCNTVPLMPPQQNSISGRIDIDAGTQTCFLGLSSPGTTAQDGTNIDYDPGFTMSYQITDLTLCTIPNESSVISAILHHPNLNHSLDLVALGHRVLGEQGKVVRMTQLSPDSWLLLGYRCNDSSADLRSGGSLNEKRMSSHDPDHSNDGRDKDDENEDIEENCQRTHKPWVESDEVRLLSLKDKQGMEWQEIYKRFPSRSHGAVKLRYYTLKKHS